MRRYLIVFLLTSAAFGLKLVLEQVFGPTLYPVVLLFCGAALLASWYGGFRVGLLAIALGTIAIGASLLKPGHGLSSGAPDDRVALLEFMVVSLVGNWLLWIASAKRPSSSQPVVPNFAWLGCFVVVNLVAAGIGQGLKLIPGVSITFWPPSGIFVAALLLNDRRTWPWWVAGACAAELAGNAIWFHNPVDLALLYSAANVAEALTAALLVRWGVTGTSSAIRQRQLGSSWNAFLFAIFAGGVAPCIGATLIASVDAMVGKHELLTAWHLVWLGDATGLLVSAPLTLALVWVWRRGGSLRLLSAIEFVGTCSLTVFITWLALSGYLPTVYLALPAILWSAVRFQVPGAWVVLAAVILTVAVFTRIGLGEFTGAPEQMHQRLIALQVFLGICALSALVVAGLSARYVQALERLRLTNRSLEARILDRTAALRENEKRLRLALEAAATGLWSWDVSSNAVIWSEETYAIHGLRVDEFDGTEAGFFRLVYPEDVDRVRKTVRAAVERMTTYASEFRIVRPDGAVRWVANLGRAKYDEQGRPLSVTGTISDITDRKVAEEHHAEHLRAMTRLCAVGNRCASPANDIDGCFVEILDAAMELTGADRGYVQLRDSTTGTLHIRAQRGFDEPFVTFFRSVPDSPDAMCGASTVPARQLIVEDVASSEVLTASASLAVLVKANVHAIQSTPMVSSTGQVLGWISTHFSVPHRPSEQQLQFMELLARQASDYLERKQAEEQTRRRAEEFQVLLDTVPLGIFVAHDSEGRTITGNRAAQDLLRTPIRNLSLTAPPHELPTNFRICRNGVELPADQLPVQRAARGEAVVNEELEVVFEDGSVVTELISAAPLYDSDGRVRGAVAGVLDITDRKRAEVGRERAMATLNSLIASAPLGVALLDAEMRYRHINEPLAEMNGLPAEAHLGKTVAEIVPDLYESVKPIFERVLSTGEPFPDFTLEGETPKAPGVKRVWRESWFPVAGAEGRPSGVGVILQEITEQRRLEQEREDSQRTLFTLVERCPFGIYIVDDQFRIASVNAGSQDKAFASVRPLIGRPFDEAMRVIWPEPIAAECINIFRHTLATGEPYFSNDFVNRRADTGQTEGYEWEAHRITLPGGRHGVVCYYFDATKLRQAEQKLRDADRKKDEFLATLAHELRNPLAPIHNALGIMRLSGSDPVTGEQLRSMMERQVEQMTRIIDDLMDVSRISQGKIQLQMTTVRLADAIRNAVDTSRPLIDAQGHTIVVDMPSEPVYVNGDLTRLSQVFGNLLNNAAKYTNKGGRIRLAVERQEGDVVVSVEDNGVGIPAPMLSSVFEMFSQVDRSLEKAQGGLGIGLNIVKRLVMKHGGNITAESAGPGMGSRFTVRLPAIQDITGTFEQDGDAKPRDITRRRILVVDDNRDSAISLAMMLKAMGNETQTAHDGMEALALAEAFRPDVILMDIGMPKLNGYDACRRIRNEKWGKGIAMVACTGWGQDENRRQSTEAGFDTHMVKPVDPSILQNILRKLSNDPG